MKKEKYSIDDLKQITNQNDRIAIALIFIANELHNIYSVLWEIKDKK